LVYSKESNSSKIPGAQLYQKTQRRNEDFSSEQQFYISGYAQTTSDALAVYAWATLTLHHGGMMIGSTDESDFRTTKVDDHLMTKEAGILGSVRYGKIRQDTPR
jgi:hypothetical protein